MSGFKNIKFVKMHGLGNDFMLLDGIRQSINIDSLPIAQWADRHSGVGFDQLLLLLPSNNADVLCRIFNSDGSEAEQCGNGMRCIASYLYNQGFVTSRSITIETRMSIVEAFVREDQQVEVSLGVPILEPGWVTLTIPSYNKPFKLFVLSLGNPHAIMTVDSLDDFPVEVVGRAISTHSHFPKGINVGFMQITDKDNLILSTYERGTGKTLACGSNASAAVVAGILNHQMNSTVAVYLPRGKLAIQWQGKDKPLKLIGDTKSVFNGQI